MIQFFSKSAPPPPPPPPQKSSVPPPPPKKELISISEPENKQDVSTKPVMEDEIGQKSDNLQVAPKTPPRVIESPEKDVKVVSPVKVSPKVERKRKRTDSIRNVAIEPHSRTIQVPEADPFDSFGSIPNKSVITQR